MKMITSIPVAAILLNFVVVTSSRDAVRINSVQLRDMPQEREIMTREKLDAYMASKDSIAGPIMDLTKSALGGISTLSQINLTQSGGEIAWEVANAVVPIIGSALALIPGVGVIASGLFLGLWSLISPIFAPKKDNPMEKMINELAKQMTKQMDDRLSSLINRTIYGEITRNNYICSKYAFLKQDYTKKLEANQSLEALDALKLMVYLDNCDNFLKDTAEAFLFYEYADVLWIPGALTTTTRLGFLTELVKYGYSLGMKRNLTIMYLNELKTDINRQFSFYTEGLKVMWKLIRGDQYTDSKDYLKGKVSKIEESACRMQSQFFYFDPSLYPYGVPKVLANNSMFAEISMKDHLTAKDTDKIKHLQILINVDKSKYTQYLPERKKDSKNYRALELMNCFLGQMYATAPSTYWFHFNTMPEKNTYSYEFRVMYLQQERGDFYKEVGVPVLSEFDKRSAKFVTNYLAVNRKLGKNEFDVRTRTCLNIEFAYSTDDADKVKNSKKLVEMPGWSRWKSCPYNYEDWAECNTGVEFFRGNFTMYSAGVFNHRDEDVNSVVVIDEPTQRSNRDSTYPPMQSGFILGVEIIVRPYID